MKMHRNSLTVAIAAALAVATTSLVAVAQGPGGGPGGPGGGRGGRGGGNMRMLEQLGLKPEQKAKLEAMSKKHREQSQALRKKQMDEIKSVLTPEQRKKLDQQMEQMRQRFGGGGPGGPGGGGRPGGGRS